MSLKMIFGFDALAGVSPLPVGWVGSVTVDKTGGGGGGPICPDGGGFESTGCCVGCVGEICPAHQSFLFRGVAVLVVVLTG